MADEQDKPVASAPAPPTEPVVRPKRDRWGAVRGLAALTWVQIIAAGLIGGLVGGGIVSLFANDGDHHRRGDRVMMVDGPFRGGDRYFDRGRGDDRGWSVPVPPRRWQGDPPQPNFPGTPAPAPAPATPSVPPSPTSTP